MSALTGYNTIVNNESIDLLYIFEGYKDVLITNPTGFRKNGVDIRSLLQGWGGGTRGYASNTGFKISNGNDVATLFQKKERFNTNWSIFYIPPNTASSIWIAAYNGIAVLATTNTFPYISRNMGKTFAQITWLNPKMSSNCKCVGMYDNNIIISSGNSYLQWSKDYGTTWFGGDVAGSVHGVDAFENVVAFVDYDGIYISSTGGGGWNAQSDSSISSLRGFRFIKISKTGNTYIAVCTRSNGDLPTTDANQLELIYCTNLNPNSSLNVWSVCTGIKPYTVALSGLRGVCGYYFGTASSPRIQYTTDGGQTWTNATGVLIGTDNNNLGIRNMYMSGRFCVASSWGSSNLGAFLYSSDYGVNWTRVSSSNLYYKALALDKNIIIGAIDKSNPDAQVQTGTITETPFPTQNSDAVNTAENARAQFMSLYNNYSVVCYPYYYIYYSTNYGNNFSQSTVDGTLSVARSWRGTAIYGTRAIACDASFIYYSTNGGATFTKSTFTSDTNNPGGNFAGVAIYENYALAATNSGTGKVFVSTNYGVNFSLITNIPAGLYRQPSISKRPDNNNYNAVISVFDFDTPTNCKIICTNNFTGSTTADVYREASFNNTPVSTMFQGGLIAKLSGNNGVACSYIGETASKCFAYTTDGGFTWSYSNATAANSQVHCVSIDGSFCVASGNTSYYISKDSGVNWTTYSVPVLGGATSVFCDAAAVSDGFAVLNVRYYNGTAVGAYNYYGRIL